MEWVDFKVIKSAVSIDRVLARYNVTLRPVGERHTLRGRCPLPTHTSKQNTSFGADTTKNIWACQSTSCVKARDGKKGGNVLDLVAIMERCTIREAALKLQTWFGIAAASAPNATEEKLSKKTEQLVAGKNESDADEIRGEDFRPETKPDELNPPLPFVLKDIDPTHPYLASRNIPEELARTFGIGFFPGRGSMAGRVVIPIHDREGSLVAYVGRSIDGSEPKYKFPVGFKKSIELYNLNRVLALGDEDRKRVIVVEGFFDCVRVHQAGFPNVVGLMGCTLSEVQENILAKEFREAIVFLDGDEAGRAAADVVAIRLARKVFVRVVTIPNDTQPDMLTCEEMHRFLTAAPSTALA